MAVYLHSNHESKEICLDYENDYLLEDESLCSKNISTISLSVAEKTVKPIFVEKEVHGFKPASSESCAQNASGSESQISKRTPVHTRESHETSPFKQAVKGFVLNKLSKKVGSSNILSGIREKIVKKLEDGEDVSSGKSDIALPIPRATDSFNEISCNTNISIVNPITCELKSVVANDLAETSGVEEAIECFEELKSSLSDLETGKKLSHSGISISLPTSPIHRISRASNSITCVNFEQNFEKPDYVDISYLFSDLKKSNDIDYDDIDSNSVTENHELKNITVDEKQAASEVCSISNVEYPKNLYNRSISEDTSNFRIRDFIYASCNPFHYILDVKNILASLTMSHILLLASIIVHNFFSLSFYITLSFDSLIIAYVSYCYICDMMLLQLKVQSGCIDHEREIPISGNSERKYEGCVKILKGNFDPDKPKDFLFDNVDVCIENNCLKILHEKKNLLKNGVGTEKDSSHSYVLTDGKIILVPTDISKTRVWNKKYPICVLLPEQDCEKDYVSEQFHTSNNEQGITDVVFLSDPSTSNPHFDVSEKKAIYIFALTDREKETWYWELNRATQNEKAKGGNVTLAAKLDNLSLELSSVATTPDFIIDKGSEETEDKHANVATKSILNFDIYTKALFQAVYVEKDILNDILDGNTSKYSESPHECSVDWLNIILGRLFYDFLTRKKWSDDVKCRIQKKLDKINMPSFIDSLKVTDIFLGTSIPKIRKVSYPMMNDMGVWLDLDFEYDGSFQMTLETKTKLPDSPNAGTDDGSTEKQNFDSSCSSDEDIGNDSPASSKPVSVCKTHGRNLIAMLEKCFNTPSFKNVAQSKFVKRYVFDISNIPLILTVEVKSLNGILALNIPPVPTDRLWYGFRKTPILSLTVYPKVGNREINLSPIVQCIEKKLIQEFQKALVMPNMEDLIIPIMHSSIYNS